MRKDERFMENMNNATKVVTGEVRFSFLNVFEPKSINGSEEKYSVSLLSKTKRPSVLAKLHELVQAAAELPGKVRRKEQERGL